MTVQRFQAMGFSARRFSLRGFVFWMWVFVGLSGTAGLADTSPTNASFTSDQIDSLAKSLEDPAERERLIKQLQVLAEAQKKGNAQQEPTLGGTSAELLKTLSEHLASSADAVLQGARMFAKVPKVGQWLESQIEDPGRRDIWLGIVRTLALVLGLSYLAMFVTDRLLVSTREAISLRHTQSLLLRSGWLLLLLLLAILPIGAFIVTAFVVLSVAQPTDKVRLVAVAWINAVVIVRGILAVNRFFFAPQQPALRFLPIEDATAHTADVWARRLGITAVYGYLALQAAFLVGLPRPLYEMSVRLLGLLLTGLVVALIMRSRRRVAQKIRELTLVMLGEPHPLHILRWLAPIWHILAIAYVFLLYGIWALAFTDGMLFVLRGTALTLIVLAAGAIASGFLERRLHEGLRMGEGTQSRLPGLETRVHRYLPAMQVGTRVIIVLLMSLAVLQAWGVATFAWFTTGIGETLALELAKIGGIVLVSLLLWEGFNLLIEDRLGLKDDARQLSARARTLLTVGRNALFVVLTVLSTLMVLSDLGINIAPLLAGAGVVGLAVGVGAQKLVQDVITGVFILFEDLISVGDVVSLGGESGRVEALTIRTVRLRDESGHVHTIPFSTIDKITNMNR